MTSAIRGTTRCAGVGELAVGELTAPPFAYPVAKPVRAGRTIRVTTREAAPARLLLHDVAGRLVRVLGRRATGRPASTRSPGTGGPPRRRGAAAASIPPGREAEAGADTARLLLFD